MELTTKNIIKILPFGNEFKDNLLATFDSLDSDQKFSIERIVWDLYDALYELRLQKNIQLEMQGSNDIDHPLNKELYKRVKEKTEQEMMNESIDTTVSVDLTQARSQIDQIIQGNKPATN